MDEETKAARAASMTEGRKKRARRATGKGSAAVVAERVHIVLGLMCRGLHTADIYALSIADKPKGLGWPVRKRQVDVYVQRARVLLRREAKLDRELHIGRAIRRLDDLYSRSHRIQDYKTALMVTRELSALLGLNAPTRIEATGDVGTVPPVLLALLADRDGVDRDLELVAEAMGRNALPASSSVRDVLAHGPAARCDE